MIHASRLNLGAAFEVHKRTRVRSRFKTPTCPQGRFARCKGEGREETAGAWTLRRRLLHPCGDLTIDKADENCAEERGVG